AVLVVEDEAETRFLYEAFFRRTRYQMIPARSVHQARSAMRRFRPAAIILDLILQGEDSWGLLAELKMHAETRDIPIIVVTTVEDQRKATSLGVDLYAVKPVQREWLLAALARLTGARNRLNILLIDDDEVTRYLVKQSLSVISAEITETTSGEEGLDYVRQRRPDLIVLDLELPGLTGFQVLDKLKSDASTSGIPVIIVTSRVLNADEARKLEDNRAPVLVKSQIGGREYSDRFKETLMRVGLLGGESDGGNNAELELHK